MFQLLQPVYPDRHGAIGTIGTIGTSATLQVIDYWQLMSATDGSGSVGHQDVCTRLTPAGATVCFTSLGPVCYSDRSVAAPPPCPRPPLLHQPRPLPTPTTRTVPLSSHTCRAPRMEPTPHWLPKPSSSPSLSRLESKTSKQTLVL